MYCIVDPHKKMERLAEACMKQGQERLIQAQRHYFKMSRCMGRKWEYENMLYRDMLVSALNWKERAEKLEDVPFLSSVGPVVFSPENFDVVVGIAVRIFNVVFMVEADSVASAFLDLGEDAEKIIIRKVQEIERELVGMGLLSRNARILGWHYDCSNGLLSLFLVYQEWKLNTWRTMERYVIMKKKQSVGIFAIS